MIKALILDIDDTLLNAQGQLTQATEAAIAEAQANDLQVILATARGYRSTAPIHRQLCLSTPAVCHAGAMVYDFAQEKPIKTWPLGPVIGRELAKLAAEHNVRISAYVDHEVWFNQMPEQPLRKDWVVKSDLAQALAGKSVLEMVVVGEAAVNTMEQAILASQLASQVAMGRWQEQGKTWLFIAQAGIDKARALDWLLPHLGLSWQGAAACGDGTADLGMLQRARWGLASPLSDPLVKKAAHAPFTLDPEEPIASLVQEILKRR